MCLFACVGFNDQLVCGTSEFLVRLGVDAGHLIVRFGVGPPLVRHKVWWHVVIESIKQVALLLLNLPSFPPSLTFPFCPSWFPFLPSSSRLILLSVPSNLPLSPLLCRTSSSGSFHDSFYVSIPCSFSSSTSVDGLPCWVARQSVHGDGHVCQLRAEDTALAAHRAGGADRVRVGFQEEFFLRLWFVICKTWTEDNQTWKSDILQNSNSEFRISVTLHIC